MPYGPEYDAWIAALEGAEEACWEDWNAERKIARRGPHTLRHTFGRLYMAAPQAELSRLQRIIGHASPETTSRYVHHDDHDSLRRLLSALASA